MSSEELFYSTRRRLQEVAPELSEEELDEEARHIVAMAELLLDAHYYDSNEEEGAPGS